MRILYKRPPTDDEDLEIRIYISPEDAPTLFPQLLHFIPITRTHDKVHDLIKALLRCLASGAILQLILEEQPET